MKEEIKAKLEQPERLEELYRSNKDRFKQSFMEIYPELDNSFPAQFWFHRLNTPKEQASLINITHWSILFVLSFIAWCIAKLPKFISIDESFFYLRNSPFIVFPFLTIYFLWRKNGSFKNWLFTALSYSLTIVFVNVLPNKPESSTIFLSIIHLPIVLWFLTGLSFSGFKLKDHLLRIDYLRFNGEFLIISVLLALSGIVLTGITLGLFSLISFSIEKFYMENIVVWGLVAIPLLSTHLVQTNPRLVNKVSPIIARIFTPLVIITLVFFLVIAITNGKDPYADRDFLVVFNGLLIGVMALIFFSIAESVTLISNWMKLQLIILSFITLVINIIALTAISYRIGEWGISPNRIAVLGSNILMFINLILIFIRLIKSIQTKESKLKIELQIAEFLPFYGIWAVIVLFVFPFLFGFN